MKDSFGWNWLGRWVVEVVGMGGMSEKEFEVDGWFIYSALNS